MNRFVEQERKIKISIIVDHIDNIKKGVFLVRSAIEGLRAIVKLLLEHGANVHAMNDEALKDASANGHLEIVKLLEAYANEREGSKNSRSKFQVYSVFY